jgi:3D (Asp-Asp-Asp) domain-containing protein
MNLISYVRGRIIITLMLTACSVAVYFTARVDSHPVDSQDIPSPVPTSQSESRATLRFSATAYCKGITTKSGVKVRAGIAAADPQLLPVGSVIDVSSAGPYDGIYTILDTGPAVQGRLIDLYMWSCYEALDFGRQHLEFRILRLGWNPADSKPRRVNDLFNQLEAEFRSSPVALKPQSPPEKKQP